MASTACLKSRLKRGPRMSRELRAEFALTLIDAPPRKLRPEVVEKIKKEIERLAQSAHPAVVRFAQTMLERYPELRLP
jgi:hypothetical protein